MAYLSLFFTAFLAATLLPLSSEALLATLLYQAYSPYLLGLSAIAGNTLGSCVNWYLGTQCLRWKNTKWFPFTESQLRAAEIRFKRYGVWTLLFAWVPLIGDPLTLVAGVMRVKFTIFFITVLIGKALRYAVVIYLSLQAFQ